jgi:hypothetical protein
MISASFKPRSTWIVGMFTHQMLQVSDKLMTFDLLLDASTARRTGSYFAVSFNSLLVGGVLSVITPTPLSVNT